MNLKTAAKILIPVGAILALTLIVYYTRNPLGPKIQIRDHVFHVELALTPKEQQQGLSGREKLQDKEGMLFVYQQKSQYQFWMKDMKFNLDFVWIDNNKVVDIMKNIPAPNPGEQPIIITPKAPVNRILEVNAGTIDTVGIQIGDTVTYLRK